MLSLTSMTLPQPSPSLQPLSWVAQVRPAAPHGGVRPQLPNSGCGCWWGWARTKDWRHHYLPLRKSPGRAGAEWEPAHSKPWLCARGRGPRQPSARLHPPFLSAIPFPAPASLQSPGGSVFSPLSNVQGPPQVWEEAVYSLQPAAVREMKLTEGCWGAKREGDRDETELCLCSL